MEILSDYDHRIIFFPNYASDIDHGVTFNSKEGKHIKLSNRYHYIHIRFQSKLEW